MRDFFWLLALLIFAVTLDVLRARTGIPVTFIDVMVGIIFLIIGYALVCSIKGDKKGLSVPSGTAEHVPCKKLLGLIIAAVMMGVLAVWAILEGGRHPLLLYTGVKGASHGYTLFMIGLLLLLVSLFTFYSFIRQLVKQGGCRKFQ